MIRKLGFFFKPPLMSLYLLSTVITIRCYLADTGVASHVLLNDVHFREVWNNIDLAFIGALLPSSELEGFMPPVFLKDMRKEKGLLEILGEGKGAIWMFQIPTSSFISHCHSQRFFKTKRKKPHETMIVMLLSIQKSLWSHFVVSQMHSFLF